MTEALSLLFNLSVLIFVLTSMFGMGLSLTVKQILAPLRNTSLVLKALAANFILAPLLAFLLARVVGLDQQLALGLFILGVSAGAPTIPKYVEMAKGDRAFGVGLMALLMVLTILYAPLVLPLLLPDVQVDTWSMLKSLITTMLIPLAVGLLVKARYESLAESLAPYMSQASSLTLMMQVVLGLLLAAGDLLGIIGTGAILAALLFAAGNLVFGWLLGGPGRDTRVVVSLGTAQRNVSAAMLIVVQNFAEPKVLLMVLTGAILMLVINSLVAGELGKRRQAEALLGRGTGTLAHGLAHRGVDQHASKCRCQAVYVPVVHQQTCHPVLYHVRHPADARRDDGHARGHRLADHHRCGLLHRRKQHQRTASVFLCKLGHAQVVQEADVLRQALASDERLAGLQVGRHGQRFPSDSQLQRREFLSQFGQRLQCEHQPLAGDHPQRAENAQGLLLPHHDEELVIHRVLYVMHPRWPQPRVGFQDVRADGDQVLHSPQRIAFKPSVAGAGHPFPPNLQGSGFPRHDAMHSHHGGQATVRRGSSVDQRAMGVHEVWLQCSQRSMQPLGLRPMPGQPPEAWLHQPVNGGPVG